MGQLPVLALHRVSNNAGGVKYFFERTTACTRKSAKLVSEGEVAVSPFPSIVGRGSQRAAAVKGAPLGAEKLPLTARSDAKQCHPGRKAPLLSFPHNKV